MQNDRFLPVLTQTQTRSYPAIKKQVGIAQTPLKLRSPNKTKQNKVRQIRHIWKSGPRWLVDQPSPRGKHEHIANANRTQKCTMQELSRITDSDRQTDRHHARRQEREVSMHIINVAVVAVVVGPDACNGVQTSKQASKKGDENHNRNGQSQVKFPWVKPLERKIFAERRTDAVVEDRVGQINHWRNFRVALRRFFRRSRSRSGHRIVNWEKCFYSATRTGSCVGEVVRGCFGPPVQKGWTCMWQKARAYYQIVCSIVSSICFLFGTGRDIRMSRSKNIGHHRTTFNAIKRFRTIDGRFNADFTSSSQLMGKFAVGRWHPSSNWSGTGGTLNRR